MPEKNLNHLLVGTDLDEASDEVLRSAAALALHSGARLHVLHALAGAEPTVEVRQAAEEALEEQLRRTLPAAVQVASRILRRGSPPQALEEAAEQVGADLLILGPHGGDRLGAAFLGSTADRVLRTSRRPCLVVRAPMRFPLRRAGVPVDFSGPSRAALRLAFRWGAQLLGADGTEARLRLLYVGWPVDRTDDPSLESTTLGPQLAAEIEAARDGSALEAAAEVLWNNSPAEGIEGWAESEELELLIVGTQGRSGLPRAILGSTAATLARRAPCSVLMVPPEAAAAIRRPALDRLLVGVDFSSGSLDAAASAARLAPQAELILAHVARVPYPPSFLRQDLPPREELIQTAVAGAEKRLREAASALPRPVRVMVREGRPPAALARLAAELAVDLLVVGAHGRWGVWTHLGSTADALLAESPVPVLLAQDFDELPPSHLLVPVDDSADARHALSWAAFLARRLGARLTALHVLSTSVLGHLRLVSSEPVARDLEQRSRQAVETWLHGELRSAGLPPDQCAATVASGVPALEILAAAGRLGCNLLVLGCRGAGKAGGLGLGSVARAVVRKGTGPVMVVPRPRP